MCERSLLTEDRARNGRSDSLRVSVDVCDEMIVDSSDDSSLQVALPLLDSKLCIDRKLTMLYHFNVESSELNSAKLICEQPCN